MAKVARLHYTICHSHFSKLADLTINSVGNFVLAKHIFYVPSSVCGLLSSTFQFPTFTTTTVDSVRLCPMRHVSQLESATVSGRVRLCPMHHVSQLESATVSGRVRLCPMHHVSQLESATVSGRVRLCPMRHVSQLESATVSGRVRLCPMRHVSQLESATVSGRVVNGLHASCARSRMTPLQK